MKRKVLGLFLVCVMLLGLGFMISAKAEGEEEPIVYSSSVVINSSIEHGNVEISKTEGNVGDIVYITVEPDILYVIDAVYANGNQILTNEEGLYQFALVDGENTVNAKFVINSEALETITEIIEIAKDEGFDAIFKPKNIVLLIFAILSIVSGTSLMVVVSKYKKIKEITTKEVTAMNQKSYEESLNNLNKTAEDTKEVALTMARCFILNQEGTPEARLAIIDELTKVQKANDNLATEVKNVINDGLEKMKQMQNAKIKAIEELEQANNNLTIKNAENEPKNDNEGRY